MNDKPKVKFKWLEKLKNVKHIEIIVVIIFIIVLFLIYSSTFKSNKKEETKTSYETDWTINGYVSGLERDLEATIEKINGVSNVKVMITLDLKDAVIEDDVIKTSNFPNIKGIVIVAKGVDNTTVKLNVLKAVEAVVEINSGRIEILLSN